MVWKLYIFRNLLEFVWLLNFKDFHDAESDFSQLDDGFYLTFNVGSL